MRTHDALAVANWFLARAESEGKTLDPMKLQKLIYFAHGWSIALTDIPFIEEHPEAWDYGPVIPSVYREFKFFGRKPITTRATKIDWPASGKMKDIINTVFYAPEINDDGDAEKLLNRIWEVYGGLTGVQLSNMTHAPGGAWHKAYHELANGRMGVDISDSLIKAEFIEKAKRVGTGSHQTNA